MKQQLLVLVACLFMVQTYSQNSLDYDWENVKIGGGGYVTGIKVHPQDPNIMYLRTDVGGAYRWNPIKNEVEQMINFRNGNYYGVAGIGLHPTNKTIVYLAVDRGNNASQSAILKSINGGLNWQVIPTQNFKFGANGGRTGTNSPDRDREGSPIAVNPNDANELWVGSREKGLWKLNGTAWTRIAAGTIPDNSAENSIRSVLFHPTNSNYIYVGYYNFGIYRSSNGGQSFNQINGGNTNLNDISDLSFSQMGTKLYAACRNKGIFRLNNPTTSSSWTNTNVPDANLNYGYLTVTASPHDDNIVIACPAVPGGDNFKRVQVSYDNGNNWDKKNNKTEVSIYDWDENDGNGAHTSQLAFDPVDPNKLYFTSWAGLWHTSNWQANQVDWRNTQARGHEEIVNTGLFAFPPNNIGNVLTVNSADHAGWITADITNFPAEDIRDLTSPSGPYLKGAGIAICEQFPANIAVSSTSSWIDGDGYLLISTNAGQSFNRANGYQPNWGKANIAIGKGNPNNMVVITNSGVRYSTDGGNTFPSSTGISGVAVENNVFFSQRALTADLVADNTFYIYRRSDGVVFRSTNQGQSWSQRGTVPFTLGGEGNTTKITAVPGQQGHLFINHNSQGLYRSINGGNSWTKISTVATAKAMSIGKEQTAGGYPTIFIAGTLNGQNLAYIYRSTDQGVTWSKISDESTLFLEAQMRHLVADRNEFGKIYASASGMGVWSGSAQNTVPSFIDILTPTLGETVQTGSTYNITWNDNLPGDVRVVLFKGGNYNRTLVSSVPSNGSYAWAVDSTIPSGIDYQIRVRSNVDLSVEDYSENFKIEPACPAVGTPCDDNDPTTINDVEDGNCNCVGTFVPGKGICQLDITPVLDGSDNEWTADSIFTPNILLGGTIANPADLTADFKLGWDDNYLYVFGKVTDDVLINDSQNPWEDDCFELYIDGGNEQSTTYDANDFQLMFRYNDPVAYNSNGPDNPSGLDFVMVPTNEGYNVEIRVSWAFIGISPATNGSKIAVDIHINDDDDGGVRDKFIAWSDTQNLAYINPSVFGEILFESCQSAFITPDICLWMEGVYDFNTNQLTTLLNQRNLLPTTQPYNTAPWNYPGTEVINNFPAQSVDWVKVSFRTSPSKASEVLTTAALLQESGCLIFPEPNFFPESLGSSFYVVVEHRNHIGIMTPTAIDVSQGIISYDFRSGDSYTNGGRGQKEIAPGIWAMFAGDGDQLKDLLGYDINGIDNASWLPVNGSFNIYGFADYNQDGDVSGLDKILWSVNNGIYSSLER